MAASPAAPSRPARRGSASASRAVPGGDWPEWRWPAARRCARRAEPIASVPTGIPAGICTVESSESMPFSDALSMGTPSTGSTVCAAQTPARCAAPPAAAMITSMPRDSASAHVLRAVCGRAMRRKHAALVRNVELREHLIGLAHGLPVRLAAHDDGDQRLSPCYCPCASV